MLIFPVCISTATTRVSQGQLAVLVDWGTKKIDIGLPLSRGRGRRVNVNRSAGCMMVQRKATAKGVG
eukprot:1157329-Pelagomonas_calceolata.AAC.4